jgi:hypothetical protein
MAHLVLLYDTKEKDLARDFQELLQELDINIVMIPKSPDRGWTLDAKERANLEGATGAIFLITAGSTRDDKSYPSPSVADEMGQAKQLFKNKPESVIYVVDRQCNIQAVDQQSYVGFDRTEMRSVLEAVTQLIRNLKAAGAYPQEIAPRKTPGIDIAKLASTTGDELKQICLDLSNRRNGWITGQDFEQHLSGMPLMIEQRGNFIKRDLQAFGLVKYSSPNPPNYSGYWVLTAIGWELARFEQRKKNDAFREALLRRTGKT